MTSTTSRPTHRTSLPNGLVTQILRDESLSKLDLARSCLVSRSFMSTAQPFLYRDMTIWLAWKEQAELGRILDESRVLLSTLRNSPSLQQHVRKLNLLCRYQLSEDEEEDEDDNEEEEEEDDSELEEDEYWEERNSSGFIDCKEILEEALQVMPRIDSSTVDDDLWESRSGGEAVLSRGKQWRELSIGGDLFGVHWESSWSRLPNLRKLQCHGVGYQQDSDHTLPNRLEVLDTSFGLNLSKPVEVSPGSRLRVLRVVLTENKLIHLALMQQLEHLYLVTIHGPFPSSLFEALSKLPSLQFLSIRITDADPIALDIITSLLDHLPSSLTHLHFPDSVPFDSLLTRLQTDKLPRIQVVGVGEWDEELSISLGDYKDGLAQLCELCEEKGIALEHITDQRNVFDV